MPPIYIVQQGAKIRIHNRQVQVEKPAPDGQTEVLLRAPLGHVDQVVLFGNIGLTTPAIQMFLTNSVDVVFLSEQGNYLGRLSGGMTPHVPLRRAQYRSLEQPAVVLAMAKRFVAAKLQHQRTLLMRHNREQPNAETSQVCEQMKMYIDAVAQKTAVSSLRGLEGAATAAYFSGLRRLFDPAWKFTSRKRQPPPDPVNALLSFGYTLMAHAVNGAVQSVGLDPFAGFLHEVAYNRPALALDVLEEFRPLVDGVVLWCCHSGQIRLEDFTPGPPERPVILSEQGCKRFIQAFEQRLDQSFLHPVRNEKLPLRQCIQEQARQVARAVMDGKPVFQSMGFR